MSKSFGFTTLLVVGLSWLGSSCALGPSNKSIATTGGAAASPAPVMATTMTATTQVMASMQMPAMGMQATTGMSSSTTQPAVVVTLGTSEHAPEIFLLCSGLAFFAVVGGSIFICRVKPL